MDMHLHTPASADWQEPNTTYLDWLQKCEARGLDIVAIADHNTVAGIAQLRQDIERLGWLEEQGRLRPQEKRTLDEYRRIGNKLLVLPGFEFTATFGFHILGIFPPETSIRELELLLLRLNVPATKLDVGSTEVGATTDVLTAYKLIDEAGGLAIAAHANSTHGVAMRDFPFGGQTKIAYTQDSHLHALEVTDLDSRSRRATDSFYNGSKPEYPRRMHCIQGSDAHRLHRSPSEKHILGIGDRATEISLSDISFEAIAEVLKGSDFALTRPYRPKKEPFDYIAAAREQGPNIVQSFHETWTRSGGRLTAILSDVVAFANTNGGTVYVGVSATRKGTPTGVEGADEAIVALKLEIQSKIVPPLDATVDVLESQARPVLRVMVTEGKEKPYCLDDNKIYVRQEAETSMAVRDEIVQLVRATLLDQMRAEISTEATADKKAAPAKAPRRKPKAASETLTITAAPELAELPVPFERPAPAEPESDAVRDDEADEMAAAALALVTPDDGTLRPPRVGVEILEAEAGRGSTSYVIKDLRNGGVIRNVTPKSARKLWSYAIAQHETNPLQADRVQWVGDIGLWQASKRAGKMRYDLVQRIGDTLHVYYGVTDDGMSGPWRQFLQENGVSETAK
ncbi:MAG: RNA-binding domain-containing protein [Anaerolineae bacterium]